MRKARGDGSFKRELDTLGERAARGLEALLASDAKQWKTVAKQIRDVRQDPSPARTALGRRRTTFEDMPEASSFDIAEAMVEREPVTVIVSKKGWIRAP